MVTAISSQIRGIHESRGRVFKIFSCHGCTIEKRGFRKVELDVLINYKNRLEMKLNIRRTLGEDKKEESNDGKVYDPKQSQKCELSDVLRKLTLEDPSTSEQGAERLNAARDQPRLYREELRMILVNTSEQDMSRIYEILQKPKLH